MKTEREDHIVESDYILCCCKHHKLHHDETLKFKLRVKNKEIRNMVVFKDLHKGKV